MASDSDLGAEVSMYDSDDYYGGESGSDNVQDDYEFEEPAALSAAPHRRKAKYQILNMRQLEERQQQVVQETSELLCVSLNEAARVLRFYKWDAAKLQDEWFTDPDQVRSKVGLVEEQPATRRHHETCAICMDAHPVADMAAARCKHYFCRECWAGYVRSAVDGGPACLDLRCPLPGCSAVVPTELVQSACDAGHLERYRAFALQSFVDDNKQLVWCTAPGCQHVAESLVDAPREALDVHCTCGMDFCFQCKEEAHRPVDCGTVRQWMQRCTAESENLTWILANTKPCPKCSRPIEKNHGCMHMTCSQCRHEFCWLCHGPWSEHGERTGGYYNCNTYKKAADRGEMDEAERQRQHARQSLERYMHYWQRWAEHDKARKTALAQLDKWEKVELEKLAEKTATPASQLRFVLDACREVVNCRRVLKWTYAVGYYSYADPDPGLSREAGELAAAHKQFFEFTQTEAERALEQITNRAETKLRSFLEGDAEKIAQEWDAFRQELMGLTDVTRTQFAKLVDFLEKGLDEGLAEFTTAALPQADALAGSSGDGAGPSGVGASDRSTSAAAPVGVTGSRQTRSSTRRQLAGKGAAPTSGEELASLEAVAGHWQCRACQFANDLRASQCEVCSRPKGPTAG